MVIENKFDIGDIVYLQTDTDQVGRMVTRILVEKTCIMYQLIAGVVASDHYEFEISADKNVLTT